jgi:hypothetical protein
MLGTDEPGFGRVSKFRSRPRRQKCGYFITSVKKNSVRDKSGELKI